MISDESILKVYCQTERNIYIHIMYIYIYTVYMHMLYIYIYIYTIIIIFPWSSDWTAQVMAEIPKSNGAAKSPVADAKAASPTTPVKSPVAKVAGHGGHGVFLEARNGGLNHPKWWISIGFPHPKWWWNADWSSRNCEFTGNKLFFGALSLTFPPWSRIE